MRLTLLRSTIKPFTTQSQHRSQRQALQLSRGPNLKFRSISSSPIKNLSRTPSANIDPQSQPLASTIEETTNKFDPTEIPKGALIYGAAGVLPYIFPSIATVYFSREVASPDSATFDPQTALMILNHLEVIQVAYGAMILSFLGALHWGLEFARFNGTRGSHSRYLVGIAPVMLGWGSLLIPYPLALITQVISFCGIYVADVKTTKLGWNPIWYSRYRTALTSVVVSSLIVTIGGTAFYKIEKDEKKLVHA